DSGARARERARVEPDAPRLRRNAAVARDAGLELDPRGLARVGGGQLLLAGGDDLDGAPRAAREERGEVLDSDAQLAAKATADPRHDHADLRGREYQNLRERVLDVEGKLGVRPQIGRASCRKGCR